MAPYIPPHKKHNKNKNKNKFQEPEQWIVSQKETNKKVDTNSKSQFPELVKVEVKKEQEESNKKTIADLFKNNKRVKNKKKKEIQDGWVKLTKNGTFDKNGIYSFEKSEEQKLEDFNKAIYDMSVVMSNRMEKYKEDEFELKGYVSEITEYSSSEEEEEDDDEFEYYDDTDEDYDDDMDF